MAPERVLVQPLPGDPNTHLVDTEMFGEPAFGGVYCIDAPEPALVESGTSHGVESVLRALRALNVDSASVRHLLLTHIHLDHAGGAGFLLAHLPEARVYVHRRGYPHLADPSRLLASAERALGEAFASYGTLKPIPEDRMTAWGGGEVLDLGDRELEAVESPGHARHHLCFLDRSTRSLYTGDAAGIYFPDDRRLIPTTPFPEFDLPQAVETMEALAALRAERLLYTHFGPRTDAQAALRKQQEEYERWGRKAADLLEDRPLEEAVRAVYDDWYTDVEGYPRPFVERIIRTNLRGFRRYYERTGDAAGTR